MGAPSCLAMVLLAVSAAMALSYDPGHVIELARKHYGTKGVRAIESWQAMLSKESGQPEEALLKAVNKYWNRTVMAGEDIYVWKQKDYWATPLQTLVKGAGDCEDYVIGKYFSLLKLGVAPDKLRLIYVKARLGRQSVAHMVLGYYPSPDADPLVLDSLVDSIRPASRRNDLTPVFSFNAQGVYVAGAMRTSVDRIGRWRTLVSKMRGEGFEP